MKRYLYYLQPLPLGKPPLFYVHLYGVFEHLKSSVTTSTVSKEQKCSMLNVSFLKTSAPAVDSEIG